MMLRCRKCERVFRENDEVKAVMSAFWHELASRVNFSVTKPHDVDSETLEHVDCLEQ